MDSNDSTVLILWDINKQEGIFDFIEHAIDKKKFYNKKSKTVTAKLSIWKKISKNNLKGLTRESLEDYMHKRQMYYEGVKATTIGSKKSKKHQLVISGINNQIAEVILLYLEHTGILQHRKSDNAYSVVKEFRDIIIEKFTSEIKEIEEKIWVEKEIYKKIDESIIIAILKWHEIKYNHPVHENILIPISRILLVANVDLKEYVKKLYTNMHRN